MDIHFTETEKIKILNYDDLYDIIQKILLRENKIDQNCEHFRGVCNSRGNFRAFCYLYLQRIANYFKNRVPSIHLSLAESCKTILSSNET
jgi:hypothetical protein